MNTTCAYCDAKPLYRDGASGAHLCPVHANLCVVGPRGETPKPPLTFRPALPADEARIARLAEHCWGAGELMRFGHSYRVNDLSAYVACDDDEIVAVAGYAQEGDTVNLVLLAVLPQWQGRGVASALVEEVVQEAQAREAKRVAAATTNAALPALALYQRVGFTVTGVLVGVLVRPGAEPARDFGDIPARDEIQLELRL